MKRVGYNVGKPTLRFSVERIQVLSICIVAVTSQGSLLAGLRHTIEEINDPSLETILGAYHEEPISLDQLLENFRSVSQMVCGDADVGPNGVPHQSFGVVPEVCRQQRFHGWPNAVNDRTKIPRLVFSRPHEFFKCGQNSAAPRVAQNHDERCAEPLRSELNAADLRGSDDVSRNADDKQIAQTLVEDDLCRHARVGTSENDSERLLGCSQLAATRLANECVAAPNARREETVPLS